MLRLDRQLQRDAWRLDWARELEMETILVGDKEATATHRRIRTFADLPAALEQL